MSTLIQTIDQDYTVALKNHEAAKVATLRLFRAALKNAQIAKRGELTDDEVIKVLKSEVKKRQESIVVFKQGQRDDLVQKETAELNYLKNYLPPELSDEELEKIVVRVIQENQLTGKDFGRAMKLVVAEVKAQADGKRVAEAVKKKLENRK